jgi:putative phage-type endonuclease
MQHTLTGTDRRKWLGGSDIAAILGISPWKTPLQLWTDKTHPAMPENADPLRLKAMNRGKRMEPYVLDMAREEYGLQIVSVNERYVDSEVPYFAAEIDAETADENIEIKTVHPFKAKEWGDEGGDSLPLHYAAQVMWGLGVRPKARTIVLALIGDDLKRYVVERDDEAISAIRQRAREFWERHVETMEPPPPASAADVHALFPRDMGTVAEADDKAALAVRELRQLREQAKSLGGRIEGLESDIKAAMGEAATLSLGGMKLATWRTTAARRFDQRAFQAAHPDLFEQFIKTTESRVFRLA